MELDPANPGYTGNTRPPIYEEKWTNIIASEGRFGIYEEGDGKFYEDGYLFRCGVAYTESYNITNNELKLYFVYQEKLYYLLFKLVYS